MIGLNIKPIKINIKPPMYSHFQATNSIANKIYEGIRWIKNPPSCCQMLSSGENESNANRLINKMARIHKILGAQ